MLTILSSLVDAMLDQAKRDHPIETCGIIAGPQKTDQPLRLVPIRNSANSPHFFQFDSQQQLRIWNDMEEREESPVVIYHSHTASAAYPSKTDRAYAMEPDAHYVIISTDPNENVPIRSFRIINGDVIEERVALVASYREQMAS